MAFGLNSYLHLDVTFSVVISVRGICKNGSPSYNDFTRFFSLIDGQKKKKDEHLIEATNHASIFSFDYLFIHLLVCYQVLYFET